MKIYKFVGAGLGVPGLPHTIKQSEGDRWMKEFERALTKERAYLAKIYEVNPDDLEGPFQAQQMPGAILKGALANKNYKALSTSKGKGTSEKPTEEKEK